MMEISEDNAHDMLKTILTNEELTQIPREIGKKLSAHFTEKFEEFIIAQAVFQQEHQSFESKVDKLQKENAEQKLDLDECRGKLELAKDFPAELQEKLDSAKNEIYKLQESMKRFSKENLEFRRQRDEAVDERDTLQMQVERQENEIERMRTELASLSTQLQAAVTALCQAKCQAFAEIEEVRSHEIAVDFNDKINTGEMMKEKLDRHLEQLAEMQIAMDRQAKMVDGLVRQRDMYKNMYQQSLKQSPTANDVAAAKSEESPMEETAETTLPPAPTESVNIEAQKELEKKKFFPSGRMISEEIDRLRKEAETNSTRCCRLKVQLNTANERFALLQANVSSYKSQIKTLEEKCNNYNTTIGKHEQTIMLLKDETMSAQSRLSRAEVQLENVRQERQLLRDSEGRLMKEREVLHRERRTHSMLRAYVESIRASLERSQAEGQLRADEQRLDDATRECAALRRRLQEEQDRFRELSSHLERQLALAQERLTEQQELATRASAELEEARNAKIKLERRDEELGAKLRELAASSRAKPITGDENLAKWLEELELQLGNSNAELRSLTEQLKAARQQSQQYCDIAESTEAQLRELTTQHEEIKRELQTALEASREEAATLGKRVKDLEAKLVKAQSGLQKTDADLREKLAIAEAKLEELDEVKGEIELIKSVLQIASTAVKDTEEKYAREMVLHSADLQQLGKLKEEWQAMMQTVGQLTQEKQSAMEVLSMAKGTWQAREKRLITEIEEMQSRVDDLDAQNALLHDQIQQLSDHTAIMQDCLDTSVESMNRSLTGIEEDSKSAEQLFKVIKYLRREKDLIVAKFDVMRAESLRVKSQYEVAEKRLKETEALLNDQRERSEIDVVTASKHAELLRKVETLNAITDSNRVLREERDALTAKLSDLETKVAVLSSEVIPLRKEARDLTAKMELMAQENACAEAYVIHWRQHAKALEEKANKASTDDWRRVLTDRENLSNRLDKSEMEEQIVKLTELTHRLGQALENKTEYSAALTKKLADKEAVLNDLKNKEVQIRQIANKYKIRYEETARRFPKFSSSVIDLARETVEVDKAKMEKSDVAKVDEQSRQEGENQLREEGRQELRQANDDIAKDIATLRKELADKEAVLNDTKNTANQLRKIAIKYKTQYEELAKSVEEDKVKMEESDVAKVDEQSSQERENQLREEGRQELRQANDELISQIEELNREISRVQSEADKKEERSKRLRRDARTKILELTAAKKKSEQKLIELRMRRDNPSGKKTTPNYTQNYFF